MQTKLASAIEQASGLDSGTVEKILIPSNDPARGDFAFPCFALAKEWKIAPPQCAKRLEAEISLPSGVAKAEAVGPYLNFFLDRSAVAKNVVEQILNTDLVDGRRRIAAGGATERLIVEYASPNIAKPLHVGHLRNMLLGLSLDRLHRHLGNTVTTIDHLGDWGTQFGFVWAGCEIWGDSTEESIDGLLERYRQAAQLRKAQEEKTVSPEDASKPDVDRAAKDYFVRLEAGDAEAVKFWEWCLNVSKKYLQQMYSRLGIAFDHQTGESFYRDKVAAVEQMIRDKGILEESEKALGVQLGDKMGGFARIFTEDGRSLYLTREIATADYRWKTFAPDRVLHVVGDQQILHFRQLIEIMRRIEHPAADRIVHIPYGYVPGFSTRNSKSTDKFSLSDLLDEAHDRALEAYQAQVSKRPEGLDEQQVAEAVGLGALFFSFLTRANIKEFKFKWEDALNFQGDTGPYIQYAVARLNGIEEKARAAGIEIGKIWDASVIGEGKPYEIVAHLARFRSVLEKSAAEFEPYHIAHYALDLARLISASYKDLRVVGEEPRLAEARLALFRASRYTLETALYLIGVPVVERM